ncbi:hypothetical protein AZF01_23085 (plasmid) [Martelella sp. AD-3]|nr:hypothetical protein AZF01_23085 [Martelella sp. AD-3]
MEIPVNQSWVIAQKVRDVHGIPEMKLNPFLGKRLSKCACRLVHVVIVCSDSYGENEVAYVFAFPVTVQVVEKILDPWAKLPRIYLLVTFGRKHYDGIVLLIEALYIDAILLDSGCTL